jgi:uncharacterized membrane-anchored protein
MYLTKWLSSSLVSLVLTALLVTVFVPFTAYAYVDQGSGSVIVTTILGLVAAVSYTFRKFFYKLRRAIFGAKDIDDTEEEE